MSLETISNIIIWRRAMRTCFRTNKQQFNVINQQKRVGEKQNNAEKFEISCQISPIFLTFSIEKEKIV